MDGAIHQRSTEIVREIDSNYITDDKHYIAGSHHVADRLRRYSNITRHIDVFAAGISDELYNYDGDLSYGSPICVGRHEFPKRPELFIHAMKHVKGLTGRIVGQGGQTERLKAMDKYLTFLHHRGEDIDDQYMWKHAIFHQDQLKFPRIRRVESNVIFTGRVSYDQLISEYAHSLCVVCPAFEEDYGLTAIEAMAFHKPVIVCSDGGGYREFIQDGVNGFIVEPEGQAIADAINYLADNPDKLKQMGDNAYEFSRQYSWEKAISHLNNILENI
jgi:Glycosyl transferases group 1.